MRSSSDGQQPNRPDASSTGGSLLASRVDAQQRLVEFAELGSVDRAMSIVGDDSGAFLELLTSLPDHLEITGFDVIDDHVVVDVAARSEPRPDRSLTLDLLASLTDAIEGRADERVRRERENKRHAQAMRSMKASSQHRIGAAAIHVARRPRDLPKFVGELRSIWKDRSRPSAAALGEHDVEPRLATPVLSVLDDFSHQCFAPELRLRPASPERWSSQLDEASLVFVESAWAGNGGRWRYALTDVEEQGRELSALLAEASRRGIPSVFWNKEDPVAFESFLPAARHFDFVFTTDAAVIDRYRSELGHHRVAALPFAAQPRLHNPIGRTEGALDRVCFAGSWRGDVYARRADDLDVLLGPALNRGLLDIYDRYAGVEGKRFPEPYQQAVVTSLPYEEMVKAYRRYAAFLNVNSVVDSPTMFSRRVFELLACGTPVISTPARGIEELLGDTVLTAETSQQTAEHLDWLLNEPEARQQHAHRGYRKVHREHSYEQRVHQILGASGATVRPPRRRVSVLCVSNRPGQLDHALESFRRQSYDEKELVFVANDPGFDADLLATISGRVPGAKVLQLDASISLGDCLNEARRLASGDFFAKFDDDDMYGSEFLSDLMLAFAYTDAAVVGKQTYYAHMQGPDETVLRFPGNEFTPATRVVGGTIVADRAQTDDIEFQALPRGSDTVFLNEVRERGGLVFSADRFNFCQVRRADVMSHTWAVEDDDFRKGTVPVGRGVRRDSIFV